MNVTENTEVHRLDLDAYEIFNVELDDFNYSLLLFIAYSNQKCVQMKDNLFLNSMQISHCCYRQLQYQKEWRITNKDTAIPKIFTGNKVPGFCWNLNNAQWLNWAHLFEIARQISIYRCSYVFSLKSHATVTTST